MRLGCIGIGSNAIRLLVAGWKKGQLCAVHRERRGTRLFAGLVGGVLTEESMQSSVNAVGELARCARADGAQEIFVLLPVPCGMRKTEANSPRGASQPAVRRWRLFPAKRKRCFLIWAQATAANAV